MYLLRGAPGSGKTAYVLKEFRSAVETGRTDVRIVVPTATLVRHYQHELARQGVVFPPKWILSLSRFAMDIAGPSIRVIPEGLRRAIVRHVLLSGIAKEFNAVASTEGMTATILDTMDLFENAGSIPQMLKAKRNLPLLPADFLKIWIAVEEHIHARGFSTRRELFQAAIGNLPASTVRAIYLDGFLTFSRLETDLLKAADQTLELTLVLPNGPEADSAHRMALGVGAIHLRFEGAGRARPRVESFVPATIEREADEICRRILDLNSKGTQFRDIGVALRDNSQYLPVIRNAFERFGIPARFYFADSFQAHPVAKFLSGLIEGALSHWEFGRTLETFRAHPRWCSSASFDAFDFALREAMPGRGADKLTEVIEAQTQLECNLHEGLLECLRIDRWRTEELTPVHWSRRLASMTELVEDRAVDIARDRTSLAAARSYAAAIQVWSAAIGEAAAFWAADAPAMPLQQFWAVARECLVGASLRVADDRRNVVHVMSAFEARQWEVGVLFLCGVSDKDYPRRHPENLLFSDSDIRRLAIPLRTARETDEEEARLFPSLRSRARQVLYLSVPSSDAAGRSVVRSSFLLDHHHETPCSLAKPEAIYRREAQGNTGTLYDATLLQQLAQLHRTVSPTGLEKLAQCNFQFFAQRALRLKLTPDKPEDRYNFLVRGNILHEFLHHWTEGMDIRALFEQTFDEVCQKNRIPKSYSLEVKRFEMGLEVEALDLRRRWHSDRSDVEIDLELPLRPGVSMKGRADRIDVAGQDCIIIDYKSGNAANVGSSIDDPTKLQGPLYALAAQQQLGYRPIAMVYWALKNGRLYGWGEIPGTQVELAPMPPGWMEAARDRIALKLDKYLTGDVHAQAANEDNCYWCDFKRGCRVEQTQLISIGSAHA